MRSAIKKALFGSGVQVKKIRYGAASGIEMPIDLDTNMQRLIGLAEAEVQDEFIAFARRSSHYLDIGSYDGFYGMVFRKYNPEGYVYLIEADPGQEALMRSNMARNGQDHHVEYISKFVGTQDDDRHISVDALMARVQPRAPFAKIDVEGAELDVLKGMEATLRNFACNIIIETHAAELEVACKALLERAGYKTKIIDNAWWRSILPEARLLSHNRWLSAWK